MTVQSPSVPPRRRTSARREAAMRYMATRELRNRPGAFQDLVDGQDVVLTSSGKPFALVIGIDGENVEETVRLVSRGRAEQAVPRAGGCQGWGRLTGGEGEKEVRPPGGPGSRRGRLPPPPSISTSSSVNLSSP